MQVVFYLESNYTLYIRKDFVLLKVKIKIERFNLIDTSFVIKSKFQT